MDHDTRVYCGGIGIEKNGRLSCISTNQEILDEENVHSSRSEDLMSIGAPIRLPCCHGATFLSQLMVCSLSQVSGTEPAQHLGALTLIKLLKERTAMKKSWTAHLADPIVLKGLTRVFQTSVRKI